MTLKLFFHGFYLLLAVAGLYSFFELPIKYGLFILMASIPTVLVVHFWQKDGGTKLDSPFAIILLSVFIGATLRGYVMVYLEDDSEVSAYLWRNEDSLAFIISALWISCAVFAFGIGYLMKAQHKNIDGLKDTEQWIKWRFILVLIVLGGGGIFGMYRFFEQMNVSVFLFGGDAVSQKSFLKLEGSEYRTSLGYWSLLASQGETLFYLCLAYMQSVYGNRKWTWQWLIIGATLALAVIFPFMKSSRSSVLYTLIIAVLFLYKNQRISSRTIIIVGIAALAGFWGMSIARRSSYSEQDYSFDIQAFLVSVGGNRNLLGVSKTAHIMMGVPSKMDYSYGITYLGLITAPIPRSAWPEKPPIKIGLDIQKEIFNEGTLAGIPPGIVAESFLNFGYIGILLIPFIGGIATKRLVLKYANQKGPYLYLIYLISVVTIVGSFFSSGINPAVSEGIQTLLPLFVIHKFCTK